MLGIMSTRRNQNLTGKAKVKIRQKILKNENNRTTVLKKKDISTGRALELPRENKTKMYLLICLF